jgi:hypothetical protein
MAKMKLGNKIKVADIEGKNAQQGLAVRGDGKAQLAKVCC